MKAQASVEYMPILAVGLIVLLFAISIVAIQPYLAYSTKINSAKEYWAYAQPIAITDYQVTQAQILLQLQNTHSIGLIVKGIAVNGIWVPFAKTEAPFNASAISMCYSAQDCFLSLWAGQKAIVFIDGINSSSHFMELCSPGGNFQDGRPYEANITILYEIQGRQETQEGKMPIVGTCQYLTINETKVEVSAPLQIITSSLPDGTANAVYMEQIDAVGCIERCEWSIFNLPWVPNFQNSTSLCQQGQCSHMLIGYPTMQNNKIIVVRVRDYSGRETTKSINLTINAPEPP
ncbi:MAG: hypothetical protein QXN37_01160 [Candidatus Anstonellaceae archaeon]